MIEESLVLMAGYSPQTVGTYNCTGFSPIEQYDQGNGRQLWISNCDLVARRIARGSWSIMLREHYSA